MAEELLGRELELKRILGYVTSAENHVNVVTKGRDGSLASFLFSQPSFVRSVQICLAEKHLPPLVLEGGPGVGRSTLLEVAAQRCELLPGLRVLRHRATAVELLRKLYDGLDEVTDEELLLSPVLRLAQGGLVLFLDDLEIGPWLPTPLPAGVRCVMSPRSSKSPPRALRLQLNALQGEAAQELQRRLGCHVDGAVNPLWLKLASQRPLKILPRDLSDLVKHSVSEMEQQLGRCVPDTLCALASSRVGLHPEEIISILGDEAAFAWRQLSEQLTDLFLHEDTGIRLKHLLQDQAEELLEPVRCAWHERLATFFLKQNDPQRRAEACYHFYRMGDELNLLNAITEWPIFEILERDHRSALLDYCRAVGGYPTVRRSLMKVFDWGGPQLRRRITVGRFLSHVGEFATAKEMLERAKPDAEDQADLGQVCTLIAENEIRYWDSLRNWSSPAALRDLMSNSQSAVNIFREILAKHDRVSARVDYAQALCRWANGCFKVSCVTNMVMAYSFLRKADDAIQEVEDLFKGYPASKVLGRAVLVRGVAKMVLGHNRQRHRLPHRAILLEGAELLSRAEEILVQAAGEVNEGSIYTHGNLGELYLHDVGHVPLALLHNTKSCLVGLKLWGAAHPNVERKLREFAAVLGAVGFSSHVQAVLSGNVSALEEMLSAFTQEHLQMDLQEWQREEDSAALDYASRRWPPPEE